MQAILDFFAGFAGFIGGIVDFVIGLVKDAVHLVYLTGVFVGQIPQYFAWLPGEFVATIVLIFAVVVFYKILGREG